MSKRKNNVLLVQVNYQYGDNVFVPYSVGTLQAYAETLPLIKENFRFLEPFFLRKNMSDIRFGRHPPDIIGFSSYIWNWEYNNALAKKIRQEFPKCLIVFGGPQVPDRSEGFFVDKPYVDILVHHEGEFAFAEILTEYLSKKPDYTKIFGLSVRTSENQTVKTPPRGRILDLSKLPSPYLSGVFDFLIPKGYLLSVCQETNRGCPYQCQYCDWGGSTYNKLVHVDEQRILQEFEWFGKNRVEYLFNCDSNYGILTRDHELTLKMVEMREKHNGYPCKFRMCTAKKSNDKIFDLMKILAGTGMSKGATLSFQSMDDHTLEIIKRKNIKINEFGSLMKKYHEAGISTYTELIMGLPGETYESSKQGINELLDAEEDAVNIFAYICTLLPNSALSQPGFVKKHGIQSSRMPILLAHSTPDSDDIVEYNNVIVGTSSMPESEWIRAFVLNLTVQCFHCLGFTKHISIVFRRLYGMNYGDFYEKLISYFLINNQTLVGKSLEYARSVIKGVTHGKKMGVVIPEFGDIDWPIDEATFLILMKEKERCYEEIRNFIGTLAEEMESHVDETLLDDLVRYQSAMIIDPFFGEHSVNLQYDIQEYFSESRDRSFPILHAPNSLSTKADNNFSGDLKKYAREIVWYGRKGGEFHHSNLMKIVL